MLEYIATIIAVVGLVWSITNTKKISKEARKTERPYIVVDDRHHKSELMQQYGLFFINIGRTPAINVTIPQRYLARYDFLREWGKIRRELAADGGETVCAEGPNRFMPLVRELEIHYEDPAGNKYLTSLQNGKLLFN